MTRTVVAIIANMKSYRPPFYRLLAYELAKSDVDLRVVYSDPDPTERLKHDTAELEAPVGVKVHALHTLRNRMTLQALPIGLLVSAELVMVVNANGYLLNYPLLTLGWFRIKRIAFWGHAFNHQGSAHSLAERFKRWLCTKSNWWFAYTLKNKRYLCDLGFPSERITVIENAVDTSAFSQDIARVSEDQIRELRLSIGLNDQSCVAIYCGSLYKDKRLDFLIDVGDRLFKNSDDFRLIVVGDGPERAKVTSALGSRSWLKYCGPVFGREKARLFAAADFFLHPGAVGLAILDSFAAGLPFITSDFDRHGPEIAYLEHEQNGMLLPFDIDQFVSGTSRIVTDRKFLALLKDGAKKSAARYTLENMVGNVANGVLKCLSANRS